MRSSLSSFAVLVMLGCSGAVPMTEDGGSGGGRAGGSTAGGSVTAGGSTAGGLPMAGGAGGGREDRDLQNRLVPDSVPLGTYSGVMACEFLGQSPAPGLGGFAPCGSYRMPVNGCNVGMLNTTTSGVLNRIQDVSLFVGEEFRLGNTHFYGNSLRWGQLPNQAFIIKFHTGASMADFPAVSSLPPGALGRMQFAFSNQPNRGEPASLFVALSRSPCDFDTARFDAGDPCYRALPPSSGALNLEIAPANVTTSPGQCHLLPDTTYYLNLRWEDPAPATRGRISCHPTSGGATYPFCGVNMSIN